MYIQYTVVTSGTVTCNDTGQDVQLIHDSGVTTTLTIAMPATPYTGQKVSIVSVGGITTLTLSSSSTIINGVSTLAAGGTVTYIYRLSKWFKA